MKRILSVLLLTAAAGSAFAGGLLTNSNQNASFLRQMSQQGIIDITGLYMNPAGTAFLGRGAHVSINIQNAKQSRDIQTTFPLFAYNTANRNSTHTFEGDANAPVIPSVQASYNWDKWSANLNFALGGGGGKCEFGQGLGTFEALYAGQIYQQSGAIVNGANSAVAAAAGVNPEYAFAGYGMDAYMKGRSYQYCFTLGSTYKIRENLAVSLGIRGIYATNNYNGWVSDVNVALASKSKYANMLGNYANYNYSLADKELALNTDQTGFSASPIIGVDWKVNEHWNLAAKYEFQTKMYLTNSSVMNEYTTSVAQTNTTLGQFADGKHIREDVPAILSVGAQYSVKNLRVMGGWNYYFDKQAKKYNDKQKGIDKGTMEFSAGAEYDVTKWLTVSGSWQSTNYRLKDSYMNDLSFNVSNNSLGVGVRIHATDRCNVDLGYMHSFYQDKTVTTTTEAGNKVDTYSRKNRVLALGVNLDF